MEALTVTVTDAKHVVESFTQVIVYTYCPGFLKALIVSDPSTSLLPDQSSVAVHVAVFCDTVQVKRADSSGRYVCLSDERLTTSWD